MGASQSTGGNSPDEAGTAGVSVSWWRRSKPAKPNPVMEDLRAQALLLKKAEAKKRAEEKERKADDTRKANEDRRKAEEDRRLADAERRQAEEDRRAADEERRYADKERRMADSTARQAEYQRRIADEDAMKHQAAREAVERQWRAGIQPVVWPTVEDIESAKRRVQYEEGVFHLAIAGVAGSGKSSLINAFRGISNNGKDPDAAPTGFIETTSAIGRYPDHRHPFIWYDIPGAGTLKIPAWQYFHAQGLYVFDCIIVLFDNRFTDADVALLENCSRMKIPSYIVGSKSEVKIDAIIRDMQDSDDEDDEDAWDMDHVARGKYYQEAREKYIRETSQCVRRCLAEANLPEQRVYLVAKDTLRKVVRESLRSNAGRSLEKGKKPLRGGGTLKGSKLDKCMIHERELLSDMLEACYERRVKA